MTNYKTLNSALAGLSTGEQSNIWRQWDYTLRNGLQAKHGQLMIHPDSPSSVLTLQCYRTRVPLFSIPPNSLASHYLYFSGFIPRVEVVAVGDEIALFFMKRSFQWVIYYCIIKLQILFSLGNVLKRKPTIWSDLWCAVDEKQKPKMLIRNPELVQ